MQIHELNTGSPASGDYLAMDTGSDTYKAKPGDVIPAYTSGDADSPNAWTTVTAVAAGLSFSTLINRITTMMKNVRFLYGLLGTTDISGIGNGTITGAVSTLNSNQTVGNIVTVSATSAVNTSNVRYVKMGHIVTVSGWIRCTTEPSESTVLFSLPAPKAEMTITAFDQNGLTIPAFTFRTSGNMEAYKGTLVNKYVNYGFTYITTE